MMRCSTTLKLINKRLVTVEGKLINIFVLYIKGLSFQPLDDFYFLFPCLNIQLKKI